METSSEYTFPIFISSTDYNLKDLRAELARFLSELGYKPILSSAEGFPDSSPTLEPWESCLPVLEKCFVMVLIIDGRYGTPLKWPHFKEVFSDKAYSPTHGEYIFAHKKIKRMFVFIRKSLMPHYQSYRTTIDNCKGDKKEAKKLLDQTLPEYVTFETLDFINEVKTTKPIPWINEFEDITAVKKEIQKKMLNELAEYFLVKNKHFETVIDSFNKVMDSLSTEEQKTALQKINATKEIIDAVDKLDGYKKEVEQAKTDLTEAQKNNSKDKDKFEKKIKELNKKISDLETETINSPTSQFFIKNGQVQLGNPSYLDTSGTVFMNPSNSVFATSGVTSLNSSVLWSKKCDQCGTLENDPFKVTASVSVYGNQFHTCPSCKRYLCNNCWPHYNPLSAMTTAALTTSSLTLGGQTSKCPKCVKEGK